MSEEKADARPTKVAVVDAITRDVSIENALLDLIDNAIGKAEEKNIVTGISTNEKGMKNYAFIDRKKLLDNIKITLDVSDEEIFIKDNCGGIEWKDAKEHIFRLGSSMLKNDVSGTLGAFGIGMKRAIYKLGRDIVFESSTNRKAFRIHIEPNWFDNEDDWAFSMKKVDVWEQPGTQIVIREKKQSPEDAIKDLSNRAKLLTDFENLGIIYGRFIRRGLQLFYNGERVEAKDVEIARKSNPRGDQGEIFQKKEISQKKAVKSENVEYSVSAGEKLKGSNLESGWYIFCNNRCIVIADRTEKVWSNPAIKNLCSIKTSRWHTQYKDFIGIANFYSDKTLELPWNTTKNELSETKKISNALADIGEMTREWIDFTNRNKEKNTKEKLFPKSWPDPTGKDTEKLKFVIAEGKRLSEWHKFPVSSAGLLRCSLELALKHICRHHNITPGNPNFMLKQLINDKAVKNSGFGEIKKTLENLKDEAVIGNLSQSLHNEISGITGEKLRGAREYIHRILNYAVYLDRQS